MSEAHGTTFRTVTLPFIIFTAIKPQDQALSVPPTLSPTSLFGLIPHQFVFTPTLVKRRPEPRAWILGDLSDPSVLTDLLHMCGIEPRP